MEMTLQDVQKAIEELKKNVSTTSLSGIQDLVREDLQTEMALIASTDTPLRNRLARITGNGKAHSWNQLLANTDANTGYKFLGTNPYGGFFPKTGLPSTTANTYKRVSASYVPLGDLANVTLFDQLAGATYQNQRQHQLKVKMINVGLMEEYAIVNGDEDVTLPNGGQMFDGLDVQITSNVYDLSGAALTLDAINAVQQLIFTEGGKPQALVMGYREQLKFNQLVLSSYYRLFQAGAGSLANIPAGINVTKWIGPFGVVDVIGHRFMAPGYGNVAKVLVIDDKSLMEDGNAIQMVDLMPITAIDLPVGDSLGFKTVVAEFSCLQLTSPGYQGKIINVGA